MSAVGQRLPSGRHGLSREEVASSQRARMLRALAGAMVEKGYAATTVADVLRGAGVSRQTFYEQFASKEACFIAAYEAAVAQLVGDGEPQGSDARGAQAVGAGAPSSHRGRDSGPGRSREDRLRAALDAYLGRLADEPELARLFLVEVYAAGPEVLRHRMASQERFAARMAATLGAREEDGFACEALVAAISSLVTSRVAVGQTARLRELCEPLVDLALRMVPER